MAGWCVKSESQDVVSIWTQVSSPADTLAPKHEGQNSVGDPAQGSFRGNHMERKCCFRARVTNGGLLSHQLQPIRGEFLQVGFPGAHQIIERIYHSGVLGCEYVPELWITQIKREPARRTLGVSDVVVSWGTGRSPWRC